MKPPTPSRARRVAAHVRLSASLERILSSELARLLERAIRTAASLVERGHHHDAVEHAKSIVLGFEKRLARRLAQAARQAAKLTVEGLKSLSPVEEQKFANAFWAAIKRWAENHAARKIVEIAETTRKHIANRLFHGVSDGKSNPEIARDIRETLGGAPAKRRAETIARTETHTATQTGGAESARDTGLALIGEWAAVEDHRTRPDHAAADGQTIEMGGRFIVGGEALRYPGDPHGSARNIINCRCVALWRPKRAGE
jgi:SPP1 gp7 family putative phage head morphogenesis protein